VAKKQWRLNVIASLPVILQANGGGSSLFAFLPFVLIFVIIYFLMIRPQSKKQKETKAMLSALQKGDKVVTIGGVLGTIAGIRENDNVIILKVSDTTKLEVTKTAIAKKLD
jgi:preprotein translocase subunit YajC